MFGFLQADGHLSQQSRQRGRLTVELSACDVDLLRKFQNLTPYNSGISERTRSTNFSESHTAAIWSLCSLEARTRINELGLPYGSKSKTIAPPDAEFSRRDYLRGLIDADGSVGFTSRGFPFVSLTTASSAIASCLRDYARGHHGSRAHPQAQHSPRYLQHPLPDGGGPASGGRPVLPRLPVPGPQAHCRRLPLGLVTPRRNEGRIHKAPLD
ncbi:LAGLIDADG family homing endonuclease [Streptomyces sp. NPDC002076]